MGWWGDCCNDMHMQRVFPVTLRTAQVYISKHNSSGLSNRQQHEDLRALAGVHTH